jgi:hypothetical protein
VTHNIYRVIYLFLRTGVEASLLHSLLKNRGCGPRGRKEKNMLYAIKVDEAVVYVGCTNNLKEEYDWHEKNFLEAQK